MKKKNYIASLFEELALEDVLTATGEEDPGNNDDIGENFWQGDMAYSAYDDTSDW